MKMLISLILGLSLFTQAAQINTSGIKNDAVTGAKIRLNNAEYIKGRNFANSANVSLFRINASDQIEAASLPYFGGFQFVTTSTGASTFIPKSDFTAKGQIPCATGSGTYLMLPVGADTFCLIADSTQTCGVKWASCSGGGSGDIRSDGTVPFAANESMGGFKITNLANPTTNQDAATKFYVDNTAPPVVKATYIAGETFAAHSVFAVKWAQSPDTINRVYKAVLSLSGDPFDVVGFAQNTTASSITAGNPIDVYISGTMTLESNVFSTAERGLRIYPDVTNGTFTTSTAFPLRTYGIVQDVNKIFVTQTPFNALTPNSTTSGITNKTFAGQLNYAGSWAFPTFGTPSIDTGAILVFGSPTTGSMYAVSPGANVNNGLRVKTFEMERLSARLVATTNQSLTAATPTIDSVVAAEPDIVLLTAQTTASENGFWYIQGGGWLRPAWGNTSADYYPGLEIHIREGTSFANSIWHQTSTVITPTFVLGTNSLTFDQTTGFVNTSATLSADTATVSADTYADVTGASLSLTAGKWDLCFEGSISFNAILSTTIEGNLAITDSSNVIQGNSIPYFKKILAALTTSTADHVNFCAREITVASPTTYKVRVRDADAAANSTITVLGAASQSGSLTNPDVKSVFYARRVQ